MSHDERPPLPAALVSENGQTASRREVAFPVVGVGASAGGLEALRLLLRALPVDTGMAFVIVQHLAPDHESSLTDILSRATKMRVREVRDEPTVEPNRVYVIPPGRDMVIAGGKLRLLPQERRARHRGIDQFFRSLAADCGHQAIGVVLSGSASDGTLGLEEIKAEGGLTFAQDDSAQHDSMPRSAVASGCVDFVLSPEKIAGEIARIARHPYVAPALETAVADEPGHARIAQIVQKATGVDFTHYKANTLHRRIKRRMLLHKHDTLPAYETHLAEVPEEVEALFQDILISVTSFFRDPAAFEALAKNVFPKLLAGRSRTEPVRIWTLGCSTGEEAFSLAIAFSECAEAAGSAVPLQLFATDLNHAGVTKARTGLYAKSIAQDVSLERLRRFFTEEAAGYRIGKALRDCCIFSRHNVLADPPFSRVDLISCRNLLIYLEPVLQQQIVPLLHYALKPGGFLWLGSSETAGTSRALFEVEDARQKIYVRRPGASPPGTRFRPWAGGALTEPFPRPEPARQVTLRAELPKEAERILLTKYVPPGVVISAAMDILQFRGDTGAYLAPAAGAASLHLLKMLREGLLVSVRGAILRAGEEGQTVRAEGLRVKGESGFRDVAVEVVPIISGATKESGFLVLFEEEGLPLREQPQAAQNTAFNTQNSDEVVRLTRELAATREYLQSVIEQQEAANEELQSANEEAQSANEEMQSVNEELETSKEEIQSSNEELATVNDELNNRSQELGRLNQTLQLSRDYAESIVASGRWPLLVLDARLRVKTANRAFYELFRVALKETEGRLIYELGNRQWNIPALRTLLEELLPQKDVIDDFEVRHTFQQIGPRIMLLNARRLPQTAGLEPFIVLAIEDISEREAHESALLRGERRYRRLFEAARDGVLIMDPATRQILDANPFMGELLGCKHEELLGKELFEIGLLKDEAASRAAFRELKESGFIRYENLPLETKGGARREVEFVSNVYEEDGNNVIQCNIRDITERKHAEAALKASEERFRGYVTTSSDVIYRMNADWSEMVQLDGRNFLADASEPIRNWLNEHIFPDDQAQVLVALHEAVRIKGVFELEHRVRRTDGTVGWTHSKAVPLLDAQGEIVEWFGAAGDVTARKQAELNLAFLAAATQDLAQLTSVDEMMPAIAAKLAAHLQLSLCVFAEIHEAQDEVVVTHDWHRADVPGVSGTYRMEDFFTSEFQKAGRAGEIFVVRDTATDPRSTGKGFSPLKVASLIMVPLIRDGQWRFALAVHHSEAWDWRADEIELVRELTVRLWTRLERLRAEEARRISEERYRYLFETMDEGYCVVEMLFDAQQKAVDYRFLEKNPAFEKLTGMPTTLGKTIRELGPEMEEYWFEILGKVALTGEPVRVENQAKSLHRWFDMNALRLGGPDSRKVAIFFNNITARKLAEHELAEKARLLDLSHDAIIVRDNEGRICYWNHGAEELYGWSRAEALGKISHHLLQTEFPIPVEQMSAELHRTGHWIGELIHTARDGRRLTVLVRKTLDRDAGGQPVAVLENLTDITARKVAEAGLRASEAFNRSIIESSPDCIKVLDLDANLLSMESGQALLGIEDIAPFLNKSWIDFWEGEHRLAASAAVESAKKTGEGKFSGFFRTMRGEPKWWDVSISAIRDSQGATERLLAVSRDVTERHALEESLVARASDLLQADRSKDEFLAMLAHELRNPLAPLRNAAEILQTADAGAEANALAQGILTRQIENMTRMIDDLLDVSRITEGKIDLRPQLVALEAVLTAAASLARPGIEARGQELAIALPAEPIYLHADATRLDQVFGNLLTNACKYSAPGCHISISAERAAAHGGEPPEVIVRVCDDGMGIAPELLPRIFDLFVQATRSLDRTHGGLGIGLTLVHRLVKMHGGSVEAHSAGLGQGSEFIVRLPILTTAAEPAPPSPAPIRDLPRRMLIVDDNEDSARSMATLQRLRGHETRTAFTGPDGLAAAAEFTPDVVLLDIGLPGMDGYEVARQLRTMPALARAFLVAMSGYGSGEDLARARAAGFDEYLVKPADLDVLRGWLRSRA